ncbi:MAG TPA: hypothetical protein VE987_05820, partial [Polyangiaceae bacterium]|nr:hypothetical protein [Polyangiaceae bacterium]
MATAETRTLVLGRNDVARLLPLRELAGALGDGFIRHSTEPQAEAARAEAAVDGAPMRAVLPGLLAGYDGCSARVDLHRPAGDGASGRPLPSGALLLVDRASGRPRAIVEATLIGAMSAAAAGALAVTALARAGAGRVALFGAGMQGAWQLGALHAVGRLEAASIFDVEGSRARQLADELARHFKAATRAVDSPEAALDGADVIVTVTPTRAAWLRREQVRPGVHVNALGADEPGKVELEAALLKGSKLVVDDRAEALRR